MKLAVVGAGWAGLAAAVALKVTGASVTVFEAAPLAGGRARRVDDLNMGAIDNGQHLLLGAYAETLALLKQLHPVRAVSDLLQQTPLHLESADGAFCLKAANAPSPFHTLWALFTARGLSWHERWLATRMIVSLKQKRWQAPARLSVAQLLERHHQSAVLCRRLWIPLCLASLNTTSDQACAQLFLNVLRDSLDAPRAHSDMLIPRVDLTELWPQAATETVTMRYRHIVRDVCPTPTAVTIDGEAFEGCVLATPPYACARILKPNESTTASNTLLAQLGAFEYRAIATLTLQLDAPWNPPHSILLLDEDPTRGHLGQWLFKRPQAHDQVTVVISDAADFLKHERKSFVDNIATQIREQVQRHPNARGHSQLTMRGVKAHRLIVEKRATFAAVPGLQRPRNQSPWARLTLAGDWTDTGYPAVLEGAVRSGNQAAKTLIKALQGGSA